MRMIEYSGRKKLQSPRPNSTLPLLTWQAEGAACHRELKVRGCRGRSGAASRAGKGDGWQGRSSEAIARPHGAPSSRPILIEAILVHGSKSASPVACRLEWVERRSRPPLFERSAFDCKRQVSGLPNGRKEMIRHKRGRVASTAGFPVPVQ